MGTQALRNRYETQWNATAQEVSNLYSGSDLAAHIQPGWMEGRILWELDVLKDLDGMEQVTSPFPLVYEE